MEGKLERAVREIRAESRAELQRIETEGRERRAELRSQTRWIIGVGVALMVAILLRPSIG